ncbi:F0F1 ATP synthase subunit alpha [Candidatus Kaiserbacteria bacterium RIFCSPLOWO2_01_FULL_54_24]|uniref:ATP synthase subunit alpha n=1 Tax=Candidatus Kaiserbacteria bacterium RIFCSPLOWO2_01_FULL_54_24 TaxID=1798515 RepID=A0A1F6EUC1_9BACT|nr:MAG: F0F1 ATP synthase subunit alpha [Candidatus Kaiserbacteria bacterium RIFCSPLOWO2_01_FULL_54_24]
MSNFIEQFKKEIEGFTPSSRPANTGTVLRVGDGVAEIEGLQGAVMSEMVRFDTAHGKALKDAVSAREVYGVVLNLEEDSVRAIILGDASAVEEGTPVLSTGEVLSIPVGEAMLGRVVSALGEPLDGLGTIACEKRNAIEREAYGVMDRQSVHQPLHTGIKAIDSMIPIGRGQRELIIGDRYTGKTTVAIDTILNQRSEPTETRPICIYVSVGQKESKTARLVAQLKEAGAMEYTIVVDAGASAPAALQYLAPFAGATLGEFFMDKGRDALIIYDDLSKHAVAYRQLSLLLRRPPGREAYPGDVFYLHSRLLERAAKLNKEKGGGSLTALPIIETQEGDVSGYIPTNVISITDGQIFLETDLFNKGIRPAINAGISVSRVGSSAQTKAMKKVSGRIKLELAQFRELEAFMQFAQDLDQDTKKRIDSGSRLMAILRQKNGQPLPFERQAIIIYAAVNGYLAGVPVERVPEYEEKLMHHFDAGGKHIPEDIAKLFEITAETEEGLKTQLKKFEETHPDLFQGDTLTPGLSKVSP